VGEVSKMEFGAPDVRVLVVDDNKMSLTLAKNLISSFGIRVDCAGSGEEAIDMMEAVHYHLAFMDYLMPGTDGAETTEKIRQKEGVYYQEIPIIALTGEDEPDVELFLKAGMNDYVSKPLGKDSLEKILQKWIPEITMSSPIGEDNESETGKDLPDIQGIVVEEGIKNSGGYDAFLSFLEDFYKLIDAKSSLLEEYLADGWIKEYAIEVHALKHSARIIGAMELSKYFQQLENLAKLGDVKSVAALTPEVLKMYRGMKSILAPYAIKENVGSKHVSTEDIIFCLRGMQEAVEAFDMDCVDLAMEQLEEFCLPEKCDVFMEKLRVAVADVAMENILVITEEMIIVLGE